MAIQWRSSMIFGDNPWKFQPAWTWEQTGACQYLMVGGRILVWCCCCTSFNNETCDQFFFFGTGEISSRVDPENTDTITFQNSKEAIYGKYSSSKGNTAPLPSSSSVVSARKSKPVWMYPAQQLESELQIPSQAQVFRQWG